MAQMQGPRWFLKGIIGLGLLIGAPLAAIPLARQWLASRQQAMLHRAEQPANPSASIRFSPDETKSLVIPDEVAASLGLTVAQVAASAPVEPLKLDGSLFLDTNSAVHVHSRFAGDVVEIGHLEPDNECPDAGFSRTLQFGDTVRQGQILAVIWSKELGVKKSELVENLSRLRLSEGRHARLAELLKKGATSESTVNEAEREVEADMISVARAERTLRSWRLTESEIEAIHVESRRIHERSGTNGAQADANWARV
ncbi:MAG: hypothetical protein ACKV0T_11640 [Planctomycetales bacterium]